eukprot:2740786-Pleurochrysis_carterae.AAC.3
MIENKDKAREKYRENARTTACTSAVQASPARFNAKLINPPHTSFSRAAKGALGERVSRVC